MITLKAYDNHLTKMAARDAEDAEKKRKEKGVKKIQVYQLSKSKGNLYWTGTTEMTPERWAGHSRECGGYIYTLIKPEEKYIARTGEYTGVK